MRVIQLEAECVLLRAAPAYKEKEVADRDAVIKAYHESREGLRAEIAR